MEWLGVVIEQVEKMGEGPFRFIVVVISVLLIRELMKMRKSMDKLHGVLAQVVGKLNGHERRIKVLERKR